MLYTRRIASTYESRCSGASHLRIVWPMYGVRPSPPPTSTSKPISPCSFLCIRRPMSWIATAARSFGEPVTAILNLRGKYENSGCRNEYWRSSSQ